MSQPVLPGPHAWPPGPLPMLGRFKSVTAALQHPQLVPLGSAGGEGDAASAARLAVRRALREGMPQTRLDEWRDELARHARQLLRRQPANRPVELVSALAQPCGLALACSVTAMPVAEAPAAAALADQLYSAAAMSRDGQLHPDALSAALALGQRLQARADSAHGLADVQTFVAMSQTVPALLAGAWRAMLGQKTVLNQMAASPDGVRPWVDELLRLGSPARVVFREALTDLDIQGLRLRRGDRLALHLWAANRDPARFAQPRRLLLGRPEAMHLGLGVGDSHCAGAALVRMALTTVTQALLDRLAQGPLDSLEAHSIGWRGGWAMRSPAGIRLTRVRMEEPLGPPVRTRCTAH